MTDCSNAEIRDLLPDLVNGRLDGAALAALRAHLDECTPCQGEVALIERARVALMFATPRIDTARIVQALPSPSAAAPRRRLMDWRIAAAITVITVGAGAVGVTYSGYSPRNADSIIVSQPMTGATPVETALVNPADGAELSVASGLNDLTEDQLRALVRQVEKIESLPAAEGHRVSVPIGGVEPDGTDSIDPMRTL